MVSWCISQLGNKLNRTELGCSETHLTKAFRVVGLGLFFLSVAITVPLASY